MEKNEIINLFINKKILSNKSGINRRPFNWKKHFDIESQNVFNEFKKSYRSDDEAWFCLCRNIELPICPICHKKKVKFTGNTKNCGLGYNTTCEDCSANCVKEKLDKFHNSIRNRTDEERHKSFLKRKKTNKERYNDENHSLFNSKSEQSNEDVNYIHVNSIEDLKNNFGNYVEFSCIKCNNTVKRHVNKYKHGTYDNLLCAKCKREKTCIEKYGYSTNLKDPKFVKESLEKKIEKYGNGCNLEKRYRTCEEKYGVKNFVETDEFRNKSIDTMIKNSGSIGESYKNRKIKSYITKLERYGSETYHNVDMFKETINNDKEMFEYENNCINRQTLIKKYGQGFLSLHLPQIYDKYENAFISNEYLNDIIKYSSIKHNFKAISKSEKEVLKYVKSIYNGEIIENDKSILKDGKSFLEIDIYLPEIKLAIDFNGIYWHSIIFKDKFYHQNKVKLCFEKGIKFIHIYEHLWNNKKDYIKNIIKECIDGSFKNVISEDNGVIIGNNDYPIFGNYDILEICEPEIHKIGIFEYYDSGKIKYRSNI